MIPLASWLGITQEVQERENVALCAPVPVDSDPLIPLYEDQAILRERIKELEEDLANAHHAAVAERAAAATREEALTLQLGTDMADRISSALTTGLSDLQSDIEAAIVEVLIPFLDLAVGKKAAAELISLIRDEIADSSEAVLEIRAPEQLSRFLEHVFRDGEAAIVLSGAPVVEVTYSGHRTRFAVLAERWIDAVRGAQNG